MSASDPRPTRSPATPPPSAPASWPAGLPYSIWRFRIVRAALVLLALVAVFGGGLWLGGRSVDTDHAASAAPAPADEVLYWTCSMHPQIKLPKFGQCPICFMDLIPVKAGADQGDAPRISLSQRARTLARVATTPVERRELTHQIDLVGKVAPDETRITYVASYLPGRLDRLFVNYTGILVRPGDHLAEIYSPELLVAQQEYLLALEAAEENHRPAPAPASPRGTSTAPAPPSTAPASGGPLYGLLEAARRKLELWGIPMDEVERLARERQPRDRLRIDAPRDGWVLERQGYEGMYVETGTRLFTLADLSTVWVLLDAYELDLPFLRYGQSVEFETDAIPGRTFTGRVAYIDPTLTEATRTVRVRVNVPNENLQLRPGMFVRARLNVRLGEEGQVIENALVGKWISPMHPEVVKDGPGKCDVCGMDLVPAESLGFAGSQTAAAKVLAAPQTAVLLTGKRAVVYVEETDTEGQPVYAGRVVELGPRAGDWYVVKAGLQEGERVVTRGAVMIDSALQIQAKPSMMQPAEAAAGSPAAQAESAPATAAAERWHVAKAGYHAQMRPVVEDYLKLADALAASDEKAAAGIVEKMRKALDALAAAEPAGLTGDAAAAFKKRTAAIRESLPAGAAPDLDTLRTKLVPLTAAVEAYLRSFGHDREQPLVRTFCPMAFDNRGAGWLQAVEKINNPYFGRRMLRCGEVRGKIAADGTEVR
ncbi:MAG: efflux RND transporter periplasmic adaptor subunit [Planctomycetota bacterium]